MNVEYIWETPNTILVSDSNGHLTKRNVSSSDIDKELVLENDLEFVNRLINELENAKFDKFDDNEYLTNIQVPLFATMAGGVVGTLYEDDAMFMGGILFGAAATVLSVIYTGVKNALYNKQIKDQKAAYNLVLEKAYEIREYTKAKLDAVRNQEGKNYFFPDITMAILPDGRFINEVTNTFNTIYKENVHGRKLKKEDLIIKK